MEGLLPTAADEDGRADDEAPDCMADLDEIEAARRKRAGRRAA